MLKYRDIYNLTSLEKKQIHSTPPSHKPSDNQQYNA